MSSSVPLLERGPDVERDADADAGVGDVERRVHVRAEVEVEEVRHIKYGYVIFDGPYFAAKERLLPYLRGQNVQSLGRYGAWVYASMEDALMDGYQFAQGL